MGSPVKRITSRPTKISSLWKNVSSSWKRNDERIIKLGEELFFFENYIHVVSSSLSLHVGEFLYLHTVMSVFRRCDCILSGFVYRSYERFIYFIRVSPYDISFDLRKIPFMKK